MAQPHRHRRHQRVREAASPRYSPSPPPAPAVTGILLDSDVIIETLRGRREVGNRLRAIEHRGVPTYCCAISLAEIWAGVRPGEEAAAEAFFHSRGEVVLDAAVGRRAGTYLARYCRRQRLGPAALDAQSSSLPDERHRVPRPVIGRLRC